MHRGFNALLLSAATILGFLACAPASFGQNSQATVSVFSDVPVSRDLLARAERQAGEIFSSAGVDIAWIDCTRPMTDRDPDPACATSYGPGDFALRITSHSSAASDTAFGVAFLDSDGRGHYADVFWTRARELNTNSRQSLDRILGSVMAHEIGHLLMGVNSHSISGVMRAHWGGDELRRMDMGTLLFLPEQGKRMRARIAEASSAGISGGAK